MPKREMTWTDWVKPPEIDDEVLCSWCNRVGSVWYASWTRGGRFYTDCFRWRHHFHVWRGKVMPKIPQLKWV